MKMHKYPPRASCLLLETKELVRCFWQNWRIALLNSLIVIDYLNILLPILCDLWQVPQLLSLSFWGYCVTKNVSIMIIYHPSVPVAQVCVLIKHMDWPWTIFPPVNDSASRLEWDLSVLNHCEPSQWGSSIFCRARWWCQGERRNEWLSQTLYNWVVGYWCITLQWCVMSLYQEETGLQSPHPCYVLWLSLGGNYRSIIPNTGLGLVSR